MSAQAALFLWYTDGAPQALEHYLAAFDGVDGVEGVSGTVLADGAGGGYFIAEVNLPGVTLNLFNGGPHQNFTDAASIKVDFDTQEQADTVYARMSAGGSESMCGWVKDPWGVAWQIVPRGLYALLNDPDPERAQRAQASMRTMRRIDLAVIEAAAAAG